MKTLTKVKKLKDCLFLGFDSFAIDGYLFLGFDSFANDGDNFVFLILKMIDFFFSKSYSELVILRINLRKLKINFGSYHYNTKSISNNLQVDILISYDFGKSGDSRIKEILFWQEPKFTDMGNMILGRAEIQDKGNMILARAEI